MNEKIKIFDIVWQSRGAGPSPNNLRTEIYFAGCNKALSGNPCPDCYNDMIWSRANILDKTPEEVFSEIRRRNLPKVITMVGGEPTDQKEGLMKLCKLLHDDGYHIIVFTWHSLEWVKENFNADELSTIDMFVTDPYDKTQRIYDWDKEDGIHNVIGSGNQHILTNIDGNEFIITAGEVIKMTLDENHHLMIYGKDGTVYG